MPRKYFEPLYYIYKITCIVTNKFYIGMHKQTREQDNYMGSGKYLSNSKRKHGKENHVKEILEYLPDLESLKAREKEIVNEELLNDKMCMNLKLGGEGGFPLHCTFGTCEKTFHRNAVIKSNVSKWNNKEYRESKRKSCSEISNRLWADKEFRKKMSESSKKSFLGKSHSEETKDLMRKKAQERVGEKNSQFGTCWITNGLENKKIKKTEVDKFINNGWKLGRNVL